MTDTLDRIDSLERRLGRVERHLGLDGYVPQAGGERSVTPAPAASSSSSAVESAAHDWMAVDESRAREQSHARSRREVLDQYLHRDVAPAPVPAPAPPVAAKLPQPRPMAPPPLPPPLPPHAPRTALVEVDRGFQQNQTPAPAPAPVAPLRYESRPAPPVGPPKQSALEQLIGLKLAGWVGAIVLVIGAGLGIKYAYQQRFFANVPSTVWLALFYACGFALLAAGEFVYRRVNKISATGLFGAGVATLFLVSYAGHGYYGLYEKHTAFALMSLSTLIGAGVAMRGKLVSIAVLSLLGGLIAPAVLHGDSNLVTPFLGYLLMLQAVALVLSWWGGTARWWTLRGLSLAGTSLWMAVVLAKSQPWGAAMWFTFLSAGLYHAEVILSALRKRAAASLEDVELGAGVSFTVIVTAILTAATLWLFRDATPMARGLWVASFSALTMMISFVLTKLPSDKRLRGLAYGYRVQAAVLLLLAIPVAFSGASISIGWAAVAIGLAAIGAKLNDRPARYAAVVAWVLALLNGIHWTTDYSTRATAHAEWLHILGQPILAWTVIGWALAFVGHTIAKLISPRDEKEAPIVSFVATGVFAVVAIAALPPLGATAVLIAYTWLLVGGDIVIRKLKLLPQAWTMLTLAAVKWIVVDTIAARLSPGWSAAAYTPLLNPLMLTGVALAGSIVGIYCIRRDAIQARFAATAEDGSVTTPSIFVLSAVALLIAVGLTLEVDRVVTQLAQSAWPTWQLRHMAWTVLWTLIASAYLFAYTKLDPAALGRRDWRGAAWLIAGVLAAKFILLDTILSGGEFWSRSSTLAPTPLLNFQTLAALIVTAGLVFVHWLLRPIAQEQQGQRDEMTPLRVGFAACIVLLWAGTLEIDRMVSSGFFPGAAVWPAWQLKNFAWSAWWAAGVSGFLAIATRTDDTKIRRLPMLRMLAHVPVLLAIKYLVLDTLVFRLARGPANTAIVANLQTLAGAILFGCLILIRHWMSAADARDAAASSLRRAAGAVAMIMLLWLGSLEIDRAFSWSAFVMGAFPKPAIAKQVALSIFWAVFAIGCIAVGFRFRTTGLRYFGLSLFALTLLKIGIIDLQNAETGYRILSFMGLGALLLITSVLYGKLSPVLLRVENREIVEAG